MGDKFEKFTVAAVHAASPFLDRDAGVEKTCRLIAEAAGKGAKLIAFPETFIPGYPFWIWTHTPAQSGRFFLDFVANSVTVPSGRNSAMPTPVSSQEVSIARTYLMEVLIVGPAASCRRPRH